MIPFLAALAMVGGSDMQVLVFSKTGGFRHDSIGVGHEMFKDFAVQHGIEVKSTEDASLFTPYNLRNYDAVVFLNTTGDILSDSQQSAFQEYIERGGGYVGIHAASDTEYGWKWYGETLGGYFMSHPQIQKASIKNEAASHPTMRMWPSTFERTDEWYDFRSNPRANVQVLASLDTSSYEGHKMGDDHPIVWCREAGQGRVWYTGFGHTKETYAEAPFREMIWRALQWVTRS